ncbi:glutamyl-tRNA reductase [Methanobrevibacter sp. DSM 116169]|uniref:glutamyl-tRNA reductase n=1 Tax=Methanobrevibacter sp. DSM 116169 TaxID=3242727 RepID=UPI0038FC1097
MIINIRVDHNLADLDTMDSASKYIDEFFFKLNEKYNVTEYVEINTCNRKEFFIHNDYCVFDEPLLNCNSENITLEFGDDAILHLLKLTSGLESMIIGEDQILGQIKTSKSKAEKENHCGNILNSVFTKAIHVGQVVRKKTKINKGHVSIGSAAVELAEKSIGDLHDKKVIVLGAGKMGKLVAKALAEKNLKAILVANRTFYTASKLAKELGGEAIFLDDLNEYLADADLIISSTSSPHYLIDRERLEKVNFKNSENTLMIDIANPRDINDDVKDLGIKLFNIDDLREIADINTKNRLNEAQEAEKIIAEEFELLNESFKLIEVEKIMGNLRYSMEEIRQKEAEKAIVKLADVEGSVKIIDSLSKSIVNKIFYDISINLKKAAIENEKDVVDASKLIFKK